MVDSMLGVGWCKQVREERLVCRGVEVVLIAGLMSKPLVVQSLETTTLYDPRLLINVADPERYSSPK